MNYLRGFQRVYAVLTVAWIGVYLLALPADRLKFWTASPPPIDYGAAVPLPSDPYAPYQKPPPTVDGGWDNTANHLPGNAGANTPPLPKGAIPLPPGAVLVDPGSDQLRIVKSDPLPDPAFSDSRIGKALRLASILFAPPLVGYAAIFLIIPWIFRGFKPGTQI